MPGTHAEDHRAFAGGREPAGKRSGASTGWAAEPANSSASERSSNLSAITASPQRHNRDREKPRGSPSHTTVGTDHVHGGSMNWISNALPNSAAPNCESTAPLAPAQAPGSSTGATGHAPTCWCSMLRARSPRVGVVPDNPLVPIASISIVQAQGRCAALSRSVPWSAVLAINPQ